MVKVYVRLIRDGYMSVEQVPEKWIEAVKTAIAE